MPKKQTDREFLLSWGITNPNYRRKTLRYQTPPEKGVYWYWFGRWVRERDVKEYGTCISCGIPITFDTCDPGHFMPAHDCGRDLLFHPLNVNAECKRCNAFDGTHLLGYAEGLDRRYGAGTAQMLRDMRNAHINNTGITKDWKRDVYADMIRALPNFSVDIVQR